MACAMNPNQSGCSQMPLAPLVSNLIPTLPNIVFPNPNLNSLIPKFLLPQGQTLNLPCEFESDCAPGYCCGTSSTNSQQNVCQLPPQGGQAIQQSWTIKKMNIQLQGYNDTSIAYGVEVEGQLGVQPGWKVHVGESSLCTSKLFED